MEPSADRPLSILVVDDEKNIRNTLTVCLEDAGCIVTGVGSADGALGAVSRTSFDAVFLDLRLGEKSGMDLLPQLLAIRSELAIVVITAYATFETAVEAIRRGAVNYLPKPFTPAQIRHVVDQLVHQQRTTRRIVDLESRLSEEVPEVDLETSSPRMQSVLDTAARAAASEATILLRGENGTGKGVIARAIHAQSPRRSRPFVTVNCPTLTEDLLASELFGHTRGAFTGAVKDQSGRVEAAEGGTLFLDEIGEISIALQSKLLRFLQEKQFERVGENKTRHADVRVVAATNRDLEQDVRDGRFREDLFFRLNVIELRVPALRDRAEDIARLAQRFLGFFARAAKRAPPELNAEALSAITAYAWPGNVRELRNVMERAVILWPAATLGLEALPGAIAPNIVNSPCLGGDFTLDEIEKEHLLRVLGRAHSQDEAARILGIDGSTLWRKRKKYEGS